MSFEDFLGKNRWKVITESGSPKCRTEEKISIDGSEDDVTVCCLPDDHFYARGIYDELRDVIVACDRSYTLILDKGELICHFSGSVAGTAETGSWTAEDIGSQGTGA